jgi:hypothetical protein
MFKYALKYLRDRDVGSMLLLLLRGLTDWFREDLSTLSGADLDSKIAAMMAVAGELSNMVTLKPMKLREPMRNFMRYVVVGLRAATGNWFLWDFSGMHNLSSTTAACSVYLQQRVCLCP